jgi:hypothetical protein
LGKQPELCLPQHLRIATRTLRCGRRRDFVGQLVQLQQFLVQQLLFEFQFQLKQQ